VRAARTATSACAAGISADIRQGDRVAPEEIFGDCAADWQELANQSAQFRQNIILARFFFAGDISGEGSAYLNEHGHMLD
jgi:hypothetical protein